MLLALRMQSIRQRMHPKHVGNGRQTAAAHLAQRQDNQAEQYSVQTCQCLHGTMQFNGHASWFFGQYSRVELIWRQWTPNKISAGIKSTKMRQIVTGAVTRCAKGVPAKSDEVLLGKLTDLYRYGEQQTTGAIHCLCRSGKP